MGRKNMEQGDRLMLEEKSKKNKTGPFSIW